MGSKKVLLQSTETADFGVPSLYRSGAPYGTEREPTETLIKSALLRLSAEHVIPPGCPTKQVDEGAPKQHHAGGPTMRNFTSSGMQSC